MATGKSTIGLRVAELEGVPFDDLDRLVERRAAASIAEIFQTKGEAEFRRLEREELDRVLEQGGKRVVALGGGALLEREIRLAALERATVITLEAPVDVVVSRASSEPRPLLMNGNGDVETRARQLLEARQRAYAEAHAHLSTAKGDVDECARRAIQVWKRSPILVAAAEHSYAVDVGADIVEGRLVELVGSPTGMLTVSDANVAKVHGGRVQKALRNRKLLELEPGEEHKTPDALLRVWNGALEAGMDRGGLFVALGGGVVCDITGFAAATWMRGTRWLALPTTLLAMVDASVGGKTAVDFSDAKNAVGAFWQPSGVVCDISFLSSEPERSFRGAVSEAVKSALIGDPELLTYLEVNADAVLAREASILEEVVRRSISVKARIVSRDERESGLRAVLNLGHTVGHALEACTGYRTFTHGEAVSLGLVSALRIGARLGSTNPSLTKRVPALLERLGLPTDLSRAPLKEAVDFLSHDKKRRGTYIHFVVVSEPGRVDTQMIPVEQLRRLALSS